MTAATAASTDAALALLRRCGGVLLASDAGLPSVSTLVAGEPVRGSWWGHPRGHEIFHVLNALEDHRDIAFCKLVDGKVTLVYRDLWPHLVAVGAERADWQIDGLSAAAVSLFELVCSGGRLRTDTSQAHAATAPEPPRRAAGELETRLLVYGAQFHTESGAHAKELRRWDVFSEARGLGAHPAASRGRAVIEQALVRLGGDPARLLPWHRRIAPSEQRAHDAGGSHARRQ